MNLAFCVSLLALIQDHAESIVYERQVKPILAARCYTCHGALDAESGLRLDTVESMLKGGDGGAAIFANDPDSSPLLERVRDTDPHSRMPPEGEGSPLTSDEIATIEAWIAAGAIAPADDRPEEDPSQHWAFLPPVSRPMPTVSDPGWETHPIDAWIAAAREQKNLPHASPAEPALLLRRLHLDLVGMPPTAAETAAFVADPSDEHYLRIVDQLLADPRHAQRWARHWMDIWRYSDWWGLGEEVRNSQKHIWHWRDWIVDSVHEDLGYDQMIRLMLASDELAPTDPEALRAGGFLARQYFKFNRDTWLDETIEHSGKAFLGLTLNCSRCHDHKYDPISTTEYYQLRAFFEPYQVRTDVVPGQLDVTADGVPRPFDCRLDAPTYRYLRGDAKQPLKDQPIAPGVPELLSFAELQILPVSLPVEAHHPGVLPWVVDAHLAQAQARISQAEAAVQTAQQNLMAAEQRAAESAANESVVSDTSPSSVSPTDDTPLLIDEFDALDTATWQVLSGEWNAAEGSLVQQATAADRSELQLLQTPPSDFEATLRFTIRSGSMWRSVGITFDSANNDQTLVYASAYAGGPKVQISVRRNGADEYPADAAKPLTLGLDQPIELRVRVRGELINVDVDGQPMLAWHSTVPRRSGGMQLITFDAQAAFDRFELRALPHDVVMRSAGADPQRLPSVAETQASLRIAQLELDAAKLVPDSIQARTFADRLRYSSETLDQEQIDFAIAEAARFARTEEAMQVEIEVAKLQLERATVLAVAVDPNDAAASAEVDNKISAAQAKLDAARMAIAAPGIEYVSLRGSFKSIESPTETPDSIAAPFPTTSSGRRTAFANWLTDRRNPLTARVAVNHLWTRHFGAPLVPTMFDFGRKGIAPSHPELLDHLAVELMENGWSLKQMHRLMVTSRTYRMSSSANGLSAAASLDPENRMLWRMNANRMEAQVVRDSLLFLSGELDLTHGGPSIPLAEADASKRRSLYFVHSHNEHHRLLSMFDDAGVQECYRREQSIVPQQALALSNSRQAIEASGAIARRIESESMSGNEAASPINNDEFIQRAFLLILSYSPNPDEQHACQQALQAWEELESDEPQQATRSARASLILALLSHNDFITIR